MLNMLGQTATLCSVSVRLAGNVQATKIVSLLASVALKSQTAVRVNLGSAPGFSIKSGPTYARIALTPIIDSLEYNVLLLHNVFFMFSRALKTSPKSDGLRPIC